MNRDLRVLAELDSLFDYRRGLIQWLATEGITDPVKRKAEGDRLWELNFKKQYQNRRLDIFDFPGYKLNDKYWELYPNRSFEHWLMYYPTNLTRNMIKTIFDLEGFNEQPIDIKSITLDININPYELTPELKDELIENVTRMFKGLVKVKLIDVDNELVDAGFYKHYDYVYRYDALSGSNTEKFIKSLKDLPIPDTCFLVPDILVKDIEDLKGEIADRIFAWSVTVAPSIKVIPIAHSFYDYLE